MNDDNMDLFLLLFDDILNKNSCIVIKKTEDSYLLYCDPDDCMSGIYIDGNKQCYEYSTKDFENIINKEFLNKMFPYNDSEAVIIRRYNYNNKSITEIETAYDSWDGYQPDETILKIEKKRKS